MIKDVLPRFFGSQCTCTCTARLSTNIVSRYILSVVIIVLQFYTELEFFIRCDEFIGILCACLNSLKLKMSSSP